MWDVQAKLLTDAAEKNNMSFSEYMRDVVVPIVAAREGLPVPVVSVTPPKMSTVPPGLDMAVLAKMVAEELRGTLSKAPRTR